MSGRTLVVSAGNLLRRGYLAVPTDRRAADGEVVNALYGVARSLVRTFSFKVPDRAVAVIDASDEAYGDALASQRARLPALLEGHGLSVVEVPDEANQVAAYARAAVAQGHDVIVLGSDKRYAQLVSDRVWWHDAYKDARYTPEMVAKRFSVSADKVAPWLALVGDDDAMPGIKGVGQKGATRLLETHGTVEAALADLDDLDTRTRNALRAASGIIPDELARGRLDRTDTLPVPLEDLGFTPPDPATVDAMYSELGFRELLSTDDREAPPPTVCATEADARDAVAQLRAAVERRPSPPGGGTGPSGRSAAAERFGARVALAVLTEDPSPVRGAVAGLAACVDESRRFYFALSGDDGAAVLGALKPWLEGPDAKIVHDLALVAASLAARDVALAGVTADTACASHLTEPSNFAPHDLPLLARLVLQRALPEDDTVRGVGGRRRSWRKVAVEEASAFAASSADATRAVWDALGPRVDTGLLDEYLALSMTLSRMARRGIGVDRDELRRVGEDFSAQEAELEREAHALAGKAFNLGSTKQLGAVLFADLGLTVYKRTKTGWSTATEALERIKGEHPIVPAVIRWRALKRMRDTWVTALGDSIDPDGRVRSTFYAARSFSGRIVNAHPDLGRVPGRTEQMQRIRRAFVAAPGTVLVSLDFSQLGLHVLAHLSQDPALVKPLRERHDMHRLTAAAVLDLPPDTVTPEQRQLGKVVNFATFAGQGASALAMQLDVTPAEAKRIIERFDARYAKVREFQDTQLALARDRGYITTIAGRPWPIGGLESLDPQDRSYAERLARRATHEGSVADVSRRSLLRADDALRAASLAAAPLLQIHDEVLFEVPEDEVERSVEVAAEAMRSAFTLEVPLRVSAKVGPNWADMTKLGD